RFAFEPKRSNPQSEMQSLVDGLSCFLKGEILRTSADVKRADRGISVSRAAQERLDSTPAGLERNGLRLVPACAEADEDGLEVADRHEIERISLDRSLAVRRASWHLSEPPSQFRLVAFDPLAGARRQLQLFAPMIDPQAGHRNRKRKVP